MIIRNPKTVTVGGSAVTGVKKIGWKSNNEYNRDAADDTLHGPPVLTHEAGTFNVEMKSGKFPVCYDVDIVVVYCEVEVNANVESTTDKTVTLHHCTCNPGYDVTAAAAGNHTVDGEFADLTGP
jgi:hypothetical protein